MAHSGSSTSSTASFFGGSSLAGRESGSSGLSMDPEVARRLFHEGGTLLWLDMPVGAEFGCDMTTWNTAQKFKGVKMIPPGMHYFYWSSVSKEGHVSPRTGFFHDFRKAEVLAKRFNPLTETIEDITGDELERMKLDLRNLDPHLGAYPYDLWKKWISLTNKISSATLARLVPMNGLIQSVSELVPAQHRTNRTERRNAAARLAAEQQQSTASSSTMSTAPMDVSGTPPGEVGGESPRTAAKRSRSDQLPKMDLKPGTEIRYTPLPTEKYPPGSNAAQITKHSMDASFQVASYFNHFNKMYGDSVSSAMSDRNQSDEVLAEMQFSFICFLVGQHYESFEHWKRLLTLFCSCHDALEEHAEFYIRLISDLHFQIFSAMRAFQCVLALALALAASVSAHHPVKVDTLASYQHGVEGEIFAVNESTLFVKDFEYDGQGPDAFFWVGTEGEPGEVGTILPYPFQGEFYEYTDSNAPIITGKFDKVNITLTLPEDLKVTDLKWISVWCRQFSVNFADAFFPEDLSFDHDGDSYAEPEDTDAEPEHEGDHHHDHHEDSDVSAEPEHSDAEPEHSDSYDDDSEQYNKDHHGLPHPLDVPNNAHDPNDRYNDDPDVGAQSGAEPESEGDHNGSGVTMAGKFEVFLALLVSFLVFSQ
ncbi:uncharacterized protein LOC131890931 isoform X2 [Tigriopus californicus]|uniref:uncharacterized protein LOC131890931 isoform X2 n=1 Tax=Tigriopus californicus TaxID=6832 RepID=UPI0027DA9793|nr:uncharacterized protein LOC131890931 isoform X2 [Tigriopus californicus]